MGTCATNNELYSEKEVLQTVSEKLGLLCKAITDFYSLYFVADNFKKTHFLDWKFGYLNKYDFKPLK